MQEEQERSEYRRFLAQFTTENFLEKVCVRIFFSLSKRVHISILREIL